MEGSVGDYLESWRRGEEKSRLSLAGSAFCPEAEARQQGQY
jgi:hypothetical protein